MSDKGYTEGLDLVKENQILAENLSKCMEEKNFVWSLWKKLQTEKPDLSSVVSLVMAREKEKTEVRDSKVLNILETKDVQIQQLEKEKDELFSELKEKDDEVNSYSLRLHDLLIEKAELQESLESVRNEYEEKIKGLVEENGYLSEVVRARQLQLQNDEDVYRAQLDDVGKEKIELHKAVKELEARVDKLNEDNFMNSAVIDENGALKDKLKSLQEELTVRKQEHEDGVATLRLRESQLQKHSKVIQEHKELLNDKEQLIIALGNEMNEVKLTHSHCEKHAREQAKLIENLQILQEQTTSVIKDQEEKFHSEITVLKEQLLEKQREQSILEKNIEQTKQECNKCVILKQELQTVKEQNEELYDLSQQKNRRISSLEKTLVSRNVEMNNSKTLDTKNKTDEQKIYELKKVLEFKQNELDALSAAHSNRLERYKNLQLEHKIVLKQLKTFESLSDEETKKREVDQLIVRASPRSLQKEDSDSVWNELQHFKKGYEQLSRERDDVMEEIDVLRVEHANDVATIHELRMCLEDEKRDLLEEIKFNNAQEKDGIKKGMERLAKEKEDAIKQIEKQKENLNAMRKENESLKGRTREQDEILERLATDVSKYKKELKSMKAKEKKRNEKEEKKIEQEEKKNEMKEKTGSLYSKDERKISDTNRLNKYVQTDLTYEEQLHEATRKLILDATKDSLELTQQQHTHRNTQTSPIKTIGEASQAENTQNTQYPDGTTIGDDSIESQGSDRQVSVDVSHHSKHETPLKKLRAKGKSPIHREWKTMRQRVLSLTQQVAALKTSKEVLIKSTNEQNLTNEKLQNDLNQCQQRLKLSKQTSERLTKELEEYVKQKQALAKTSKEYKIPSYPTEKHLEDRLKLSANECSRLSCELKTSRKTNVELEEKLKSCQERNTRQEHLLAQKKVFVEEMKSRLKLAQENLESTVDELKRTEDKANQRKTQIETIKRQLDSEVSHRQKFERLHQQDQEQLKKKAQLLSQAQSLRQEAEIAVNEMEEAAKNQLHSLANQSQVTLKGIEVQLNKSRQRTEELEVVVRTLMEELVGRLSNIKIRNKQDEYKRNEEEKNKASMVQACELASSILNMSKADIDELLDVDLAENEDSSNYSNEEWQRKVEHELSKQNSFSHPLLEIFLEIIGYLLDFQNTENR